MIAARRLAARALGAVALAACLLPPALAAEDPPLALASVFGDHMVLQGGGAAPVWGRAAPGEELTLTLGSVSAHVVAGADGRFRAELQLPEAGGPFELQLSGAGERRLVLQDVLVGDVWVCAGGSNMIWPLRLAQHDAQDNADANDGLLRLCTVPEQESARAAEDVAARWEVSSVAAIADFSAVGFSFGHALRRRLARPVGLVSLAVPFAHIAPWIPDAALRAAPRLSPLVEQVDRGRDEWRSALLPALPAFRDWVAATRRALLAGAAVPPMPPLPRDPRLSRDAPTALANGMLAPFTGAALKGVIWYQGEQDIGDGLQYAARLTALIRGWRSVLGHAELPFGIVQLAPYRYGGRRATEKAPDAPSPYRLPELWEAQSVALGLPATGLVVTLDLADLDNLCPLDKHGVGNRLADWALGEVYGLPDAPSRSPRFAGLKAEGARLRVRFSDVGSGLKTRDGQPAGDFEIAGADQRFVPAQARLEGEVVVLWSEEVKQPAAARFSWNQEAQPNLVGGNGLPAAPFRAVLSRR